MPLRFNQKELLVLANKPDENFDKLGVLLIRESEGKLFHKSESKFIENYHLVVLGCQKKGFYFITPLFCIILGWLKIPMSNTFFDQPTI